jgi:hypothetical protein
VGTFLVCYKHKKSSAPLPHSEAVHFLGKQHYNACVALILLALQDDFRTIKWEEEYPFPSFALKDMKELLNV